ncbi:MAG TPA: hypothetical protein VD996_03500, partial [Chitinophagaceae bacterium]|nr:hypothetical protein [Chitinophagaceae bacterium]
MKKSTLVVFLLLSCFMSVRAEPSASVFGINNIVLKNFQAIQIPSGARVIWEFASEEKDVTCHLEKSSDGVTFTAVAAISVSSTREQAIHAYVDKDAAAGETIYRLRVTKES